MPYRYYGDAYDKVWPSTACFVTSNLFCCGKQESPLPQHCERQSPDVSQKNFQAAEQFGFIILGLAFLKKKKNQDCRTYQFVVCVAADLLADKFEYVLFQVLA